VDDNVNTERPYEPYEPPKRPDNPSRKQLVYYGVDTFFRWVEAGARLRDCILNGIARGIWNLFKGLVSLPFLWIGRYQWHRDLDKLDEILEDTNRPIINEFSEDDDRLHAALLDLVGESAIWVKIADVAERAQEAYEFRGGAELARLYFTSGRFAELNLPDDTNYTTCKHDGEWMVRRYGPRPGVYPPSVQNSRRRTSK
jgi:hypothetical protein